MLGKSGRVHTAHCLAVGVCEREKERVRLKSLYHGGDSVRWGTGV